MSRHIIAFGLDGTLTNHDRSASKRMVSYLKELIVYTDVAIITSADFAAVERRLLLPLALPPRHAEKLHILANMGTHYYRYSKSRRKWVTIYSHDMETTDRRTIMRVLEDTATRMNLWPERPFGEVIEDKASEIRYSVLGHSAPAEQRYKWAEQNDSLRRRFVQKLRELLPDFDVKPAGMTEVEVTPPAKKRQAMVNRFLEFNDISKEQMVFVGDKLGRGGLFYPVRQSGVRTLEIGGCEDALYIIKGMIAAYSCESGD